MSKLDELIAELCPDGVEYKTIGSCVEKVSNIKWAEHRDEDYRYIDLTSVDRDTHQITDTQTINANNAPSRAQQIVQENDVLLGATRPLLKRYCIIPEDYDGEICSTGFCVLRAKTNSVLSRYLYHIISSTDFFLYVEKYQKGASYPAISDADTKSYKFPVPPLEVQREIVRVLDNFTFLSAELSAELSARRKQYDYYREQLINEADGISGKLIDLLNQPITDGPHTTPKLVPEGVPFVSATAIWDGKVHFEKAQGFITKEFDTECAKKYKPRKNDVFMVKSGSTTGKVAFVDTDEDFNIWSPLAAMRTDNVITARYIYHFLQTPSAQGMVLTRMSHGSQPNLSMRVLEQFDVKIPPIEEQERIVRLLDRFDVLCSDISSGLPAEIETRQRQYEYYRDKLLTFDIKAK